MNALITMLTILVGIISTLIRVVEITPSVRGDHYRHHGDVVLCAAHSTVHVHTFLSRRKRLSVRDRAHCLACQPIGRTRRILLTLRLIWRSFLTVRKYRRMYTPLGLRRDTPLVLSGAPIPTRHRMPDVINIQGIAPLAWTGSKYVPVPAGGADDGIRDPNDPDKEGHMEEFSIEISPDELPGTIAAAIKWATTNKSIQPNLSSIFVTNRLIRLVWNAHDEQVRLLGGGAFPHIEHDLGKGSEFAVRLVHRPNESGKGMSMVDNGKFLEDLAAVPGKSGKNITTTLILDSQKTGTDAFRTKLVRYKTTSGDKGLKRSKALWHFTDMYMTIDLVDLRLAFFDTFFGGIMFDTAEVDGDGYIRRSFAEKLLVHAGKKSINTMKKTDVLSNVIIALPDETVVKGHLIIIDDEAFDRIKPDANIITSKPDNLKKDFGLKGGDVAVLSAKPYAQFKVARTGGQWEGIFPSLLNKPYLNGDSLIEYSVNEELGMAMARTALGKPAWTPRSDKDELDKAGDEISLYTRLGMVMEEAFGSILPAVHVTQHSARRELENMSPFKNQYGKVVLDQFEPLGRGIMAADRRLSFKLPATKLASIRSDAYLRLFYPDRTVDSHKAIIDGRRGVVLGKGIIGDALWAMGKGDLDDVAKWTRARFTENFDFRGVTITPEDEVFIAHRTPSNCVIGTHRETGETGVVGHEYYIVRLDMSDAETARRIESFGKPVKVDPNDIPVNIRDINTDHMLTEAPTDGKRDYWDGLEYIESNPGVFSSYSIVMTALATFLEIHYGGRLPEGFEFESSMVTEYAIDSWTNVAVDGIKDTDKENTRVRLLFEALVRHHGSIDAHTAARLGWMTRDGKLFFPSMNPREDVPVTFPLHADSPTNRVVKQFEATKVLKDFTEEFIDTYLGIMKGLWHGTELEEEIAHFGGILNLFYRSTPGGSTNKGRVAGTHLIDKDAPEYDRFALPYVDDPYVVYTAYLAQTTNPTKKRRNLGGWMYPISNMMFSVTAAPFIVARLEEYEELSDTKLMDTIFDALKQHFYGAQIDKLDKTLDTHMLVFVERLLATLRIPMQGTLNHVRQDMMSARWHNIAPVSETLSSEGGTVLDLGDGPVTLDNIINKPNSKNKAVTRDEEGNVVEASTLDDLL